MQKRRAEGANQSGETFKEGKSAQIQREIFEIFVFGHFHTLIHLFAMKSQQSSIASVFGVCVRLEHRTVLRTSLCTQMHKLPNKFNDR